MALNPFSWQRGTAGRGSLLQVDKLDVHYGRAHALQGVSLTLEHGVLAVVGRNGMGKTTLCNAITGLVPASGSIRFGGVEILGLAPNLITNRGIGYVPQGRRVWPSLTVDEHLRLAQRSKTGPWTIARVYDLFPRLAERKRNYGNQLSGGEQQMLAVGRALAGNPKLLLLDEPFEGLAPVIIDTLAAALMRLKTESRIAILLVEQQVDVALELTRSTIVLDKGQVVWRGDSADLAADRDNLAVLVGLQEGEGGR
jgi:ABC-type branched-subunit amino acid transport system ATPase component